MTDRIITPSRRQPVSPSSNPSWQHPFTGKQRFMPGRRSCLASVLSLCCGAAWASQEARVAVPRDWWVNLDNDRAASIASALRAGADPNLRNEEGMPSVMYAVRKSAWNVFDVLAAAPGLNLEARNRWDENVLMYAALMGQTGRVEQLLRRGAEINKLGWTALHYAAAGGHEDTVDLLLANGAMVNAPAPDGTSPLMMAAQANSRPAVERLLQAGAHLAQQTTDGRNAVDFAESKGHTRMAEELRTLMARRPANR
ncbi:ankyrin repeat domain-containing protein [Kerstersia gyiorum]|uniref:ankyrin repeat domain-containing protein n=1 Tax=Kerstersia gyiorum TaxID=206506 RepID=UPI00209EF0CA|nr:ankyrin repeat domain-containing protein [Kerstersia gyiorum]MCP1678625.1 ankyrin repeat protein [Kerstersia gyiorum]MCP1822920.1 ankyrin repeat protein [Kerstersia gyiorum]MCP1826478.1 ankyrin repeat protein [Kerstersia gyiorum]MCW2450147.1 ankyrin repeat protein [Kerstersia gyiorum]